MDTKNVFQANSVAMHFPFNLKQFAARRKVFHVSAAVCTHFLSFRPDYAAKGDIWKRVFHSVMKLRLPQTHSNADVNTIKSTWWRVGVPCVFQSPCYVNRYILKCRRFQLKTRLYDRAIYVCVCIYIYIHVFMYVCPVLKLLKCTDYMQQNKNIKW